MRRTNLNATNMMILVGVDWKEGKERVKGNGNGKGGEGEGGRQWRLTGGTVEKG